MTMVAGYGGLVYRALTAGTKARRAARWPDALAAAGLRVVLGGQAFPWGQSLAMVDHATPPPYVSAQ
jgi:hypothetical protein